MSLDIITLPGRDFILGAKKTIGVNNIRNIVGSSVAAATGTVIIYNSAGATSLVSTNLSMSFSTDNKKGKATYLLTTGAGMDITAAGTYRAIYTITYGSTIQKWQQTIVIKAHPF